MDLVRAHGRSACVALLVLAVIFLAVPLIMRAFVQQFIYISPETAPSAEVAIVLGASVVHGEPSPVLAARAQEAVALYMDGKVSKILVTGDNGALSHDEVTPVRKYLVAAGIPSRNIFLDHAGFDTYSSMYRARTIFGVHRAVVVSQGFHLPRALFIARSLGIDAVGVEANPGTRDLYDLIREIPASWKALLDLALHRVPKYLGPAIPLSGDGRGTWY